MLCGNVTLSSFPSRGIRIQECRGGVSSTWAIYSPQWDFPSGAEGTKGGTNLGAAIHHREDIKLMCCYPGDDDLDTSYLRGSSHRFLFKLLYEGKQSPLRERCKASEFSLYH